MISYLSGIPIAKTDRALTLNVNGVGYKVNAPLPLLSKIELHLPLELHTYTNGMELFASPIERTKHAIASGNVAVLNQIPGIGKKTAERLIVELKDKIRIEAERQGENMGENAVVLGPSQMIPEEVNEALENLGYKPKDIQRVFRSLKEPITQAEEMVKYFLKNV